MEINSKDTTTLVAPLRNRVFDQIIRFITGQILVGALKPGDRLLPERELAEKLGVGRPSVREALRALEMLDLIEIRQGSGAFVRSPQPQTLSTIFGVVLSLQPSMSEEILHARIAIECEAVRLACQKANAADIDTLEAALRRMPADEATSKGESGAQADFEFHTAIVEASKNTPLIFLYRSIEVLLRKSHLDRRIAIFEAPSLISALNAAHAEVFDAIERRDEEDAERKLREHFFLVQRYYKDVKGSGAGHAPNASNQPRSDAQEKENKHD